MSIVLNGICKKYNSNTNRENVVLRDISIQIHDGEMVAIKGRSGAGKSTLLHIIGCLDVPTSGEYYLDNKSISQYNDRDIAKIRNQMFGYVMQDFGLINDDTVLFNIRLPLFLGNKSIESSNESIDEKLKLMGIYELKDRLVDSVSGGEKQRVAIARALVNNPKYILADEPTGALDTTNSKIIMSILKELNKQGKTVIIITHDASIASECNRILTIEDGIITE